MDRCAILLVAGTLAAQTPPDVARERAAFAAWLAADARSPYAALALQPIGRGLTLGPPPSDIELAGIGRTSLTETGGVVRLGGAATGAAGRALPRGRPVPFGPYRLAIDGEPGRSVAVVYGEPRHAAPPSFYPYDPALDVVGTLTAAPAITQRLLALDGVEVAATHAGTFAARLGETPVRLTVYRMPDPAGEESDLMIYFRDLTSDRGSYPAGRFVALEPAGGGRYRVDFNRARNPLCAYSSVFPCPVPWPGNTLSLPVAAGERYVPPRANP